MAIAAAAAPPWTDTWTTIGTLAAVVVALGIALWSEFMSGRRAKEERERGDRQLAEQRDLEKAAIEDERDHGRAELEEERRLARDREQLAQAYAVQVAFGDTAPDGQERDNFGNLVRVEVRKLAVIVVNRSPFTITRVEAQFCLGNNMITHHGYQRVSGFEKVPEALREGYRPSTERQMSGVLTPFDEGIRFETDETHERHLAGPYPVVRWTDQWGTRWKHKRGVVRRISDTEQWEP